MATTTFTANSTWTAIDAGEADVNLCNKSRTTSMRYAVGSSAPTGDTDGLILKAGETVPVMVASGSNLYVRADIISGNVGAVPGAYIDGQ
jgi:hypothetical protein